MPKEVSKPRRASKAANELYIEILNSTIQNALNGVTSFRCNSHRRGELLTISASYEIQLHDNIENRIESGIKNAPSWLLLKTCIHDYDRHIIHLLRELNHTSALDSQPDWASCPSEDDICEGIQEELVDSIQRQLREAATAAATDIANYLPRLNELFRMQLLDGTEESLKALFTEAKTTIIEKCKTMKKQMATAHENILPAPIKRKKTQGPLNLYEVES